MELRLHAPSQPRNLPCRSRYAPPAPPRRGPGHRRPGPGRPRPPKFNYLYQVFYNQRRHHFPPRPRTPAAPSILPACSAASSFSSPVQVRPPSQIRGLNRFRVPRVWSIGRGRTREKEIATAISLPMRINSAVSPFGTEPVRFRTSVKMPVSRTTKEMGAEKDNADLPLL